MTKIVFVVGGLLGLLWENTAFCEYGYPGDEIKISKSAESESWAARYRQNEENLKNLEGTARKEVADWISGFEKFQGEQTEIQTNWFAGLKSAIDETRNPWVQKSLYAFLDAEIERTERVVREILGVVRRAGEQQRESIRSEAGSLKDKLYRDWKFEMGDPFSGPRKNRKALEVQIETRWGAELARMEELTDFNGRVQREVEQYPKRVTEPQGCHWLSFELLTSGEMAIYDRSQFKVAVVKGFRSFACKKALAVPLNQKVRKYCCPVSKQI